MDTHDDRPPMTVVKMPLRNRSPNALQVRLEPWGQTLLLPSGTTWELVARGPGGESLELLREEDLVTVYGWSGATLRVLHEGRDVDGGARLTAPRIPEGMRMREWVEALASTPSAVS